MEDFLFGATRISLAPVRTHLRELFDGRCFYCNAALGDAVDIDHFIAWARHADNTIENLVPAHPACNASKSDHLAAAEHVAGWVEHLQMRGDDLAEIARTTGWDHASGRTLAVARVIYLRLPEEVRLWRGRDAFEPVDRARLLHALAG